MKRAKHMLAMAVMLAMTAGLIARAADGDDATPIIDDDSEFVSPDGLTITNSANDERFRPNGAGRNSSGTNGPAMAGLPVSIASVVVIASALIGGISIAAIL